MEAMPTAREPALRASWLAILYEPLLWAAFAAFVGGALGLFGTFLQAALEISYTPTLSTIYFVAVAQYSGQALAAFSLIGVPSLLGPHSRTKVRRSVVLGRLLLLLLAATFVVLVFFLIYMNTGEWLGASIRPTPPLYEASWPLYEVSFWTSIFLPMAVALPYAVVAMSARKIRLGTLLAFLCILNLPFLAIRFLLFPPAPYVPSAALAVFGGYGWGVSLLEASCWALLGATLFHGAHERVLAKASRAREKKNREAAHYLYEEGLGRGNLSVVTEVVSEDFRDLGRGTNGKLGMERLITDLWASYPDLSVSVEDQEVEGDLVRTRLLLSGTDRGSGVMWYPPTGRYVSFKAECVDRFRGGELVEHEGMADTEGLLWQLGHYQEGYPSSYPNS
jgi:predicted ester cyclase